MKSFVRLSLAIAMTSLMSAGCSDSTTTTATTVGPLDGTWVMATWTCGSSNIKAFLDTAAGATTIVTWVIANTAGTSKLGVGTCSQNTAETYAFPSTTTFKITDGATTCPAACSLGSFGTCTASAATGLVSTYSYTVANKVLTISRTLSASDISGNSTYGSVGCTAGQTETSVLAKQ